ncbi:unnamed protein product [Orchesella dallaii]|uniref:Diacylglycerol O-acyltransferase n=1 Tax=Orchesella dallaii TaxID=48710 RepID=A0ABP1Q154_9HEXA
MDSYTKFALLVKKSGIILWGIFCTCVLFLFVILSLPIYLLRFVLIVFARHFHAKSLGNPITSLGTCFASEFPPSNQKNSPRSTVVATFVIEGEVPMESVETLIKRRWFESETEGEVINLKCRYPELQQYVESWMGFLFWKQDPEFQLQNHLKTHHLHSDTEMEEHYCSFIEDLINKTFVPKRSPWEIYIVPNYQNELYEIQNEVNTLLAIRFHHSLADGFSIFHAVIEHLLGTPLPLPKLFNPSYKQFYSTGANNSIL